MLLFILRIIAGQNEEAINSLYDPYFYTGKRKSCHSITITLLRNNNVIPLEGDINEENDYNVFSNNPKLAKILLIKK